VLNIDWKFEEHDGVAFTGKVGGIAVAAERRVDLGRRGWGGEDDIRTEGTQPREINNKSGDTVDAMITTQFRDRLGTP
jgi:hypothetical protein